MKQFRAVPLDNEIFIGRFNWMSLNLEIHVFHISVVDLGGFLGCYGTPPFSQYNACAKKAAYL